MQSFYIDTCIWLNLFKKEKGFCSQPLWQTAQIFIDKCLFDHEKQIIYSNVVLRELAFKLSPKEYSEKKNFFQNEHKIIYHKISLEEYDYARELERRFNYELSFYDCIHTATCKSNDFVLITRDKFLLKKANEIINALKPEDA